jgi:mevalonate pyrophosphate decarboxylase
VLLLSGLLFQRYSVRASVRAMHQRVSNLCSSGSRGRSVTGCFRVILWSRAKVHERREKAYQLDLKELSGIP